MRNFLLQKAEPLSKTPPSSSGGKPPQSAERPADRAGWAEGLRKLYDDVVAEPLPDSFEELLKRLDQQDKD